jgi:hypothetical protein
MEIAVKVLDLRLASIERCLELAQDPRIWFSKMKPDGAVAENLWEFAFEKIQDEAGDLELEIEELRRRLSEELTEERAWPSYQKILARSELVFSECLDLLGGLALRDRSTDDQICQLADELIYECAQPSFRVLATMPSLAHDLGDSLTSSMLRRVASIRFPDWTLWTVPLVAHEYAYVMTELEEVLRSHVSLEASAWCLEHRPDPGSDDIAEEIRLRAQNYARVLLADAFATFAMGPAYACAAVLLRLDPAYDGHRYRPSDSTRARMILGVLDEMNRTSMGAYEDILQFLTRRWEEISQLVPTAAAAEAEDVLVPERVSAYLQRKFKYKRTGYTPQGWTEARKWSMEWQGSERRPTVPEDLGAAHSLRDALNAVWDCRVAFTEKFESPGDRDEAVDRIAEVGRDLCREIVGRKESGHGRAVPRANREGVRS